MKKIVFCVLFVLLPMSIVLGQNRELLKIGEKKEGKNIITKDLSFLKKEIKTDYKSEKLSDFQIIEAIDLGNKSTYYYLLTVNKDNTLKIAIELILDDKYFCLLDSKGSRTTVSCEGCAWGCNPEKVDGSWYCSGGCGDNCTKTVTVKELGTGG